MHLIFRRGPVTGATSSAAALAGILALTSPAAADDLTVKNNADVSVKVVVKNGSTDVGHADISKKSSGKIPLAAGVSPAKITSVEATSLGASTHCSASKTGSSQYDVKCDAVASAPAAPSGAGGPATTAAKPATRNLEIVNDLKNDATVMLEYVKDGKSFHDDHDIRSGASFVFTVSADDQMTVFNVLRHLDMERVSCGAQMRYLIPASQQKMYVTPVDDKSPPPDSIKRADSRPCVLSLTSRTEKADPKTSNAPPAAGGGTSATTKFTVENDLKDPVEISTMGGMTETHVINPKQTVTFDHAVPHPDKGNTLVDVYISRSHETRLFLCGNRLQYAIPPMPEVKFFVTRVAGAEWPPKPKPGEKDGGGGGGGKDGGLPPPPSCELTRTQNFEK
jgi:hypothetical protein